jgi:hypothetical protein
MGRPNDRPAAVTTRSGKREKKEMRMNADSRWKTSSAILIASSLVLFASGCGLLGPQVETETYQTDDGAIVVESVELTATVKAVDKRARTLTLDPRYGDTRTVKVGPNMTNFNQIRVGDEVHAEIVEELAVKLIVGGASESIGELDAVKLAPVGAKPGITVVSSREVTADIIGIDAHAHKITLEFIDGSTSAVKVGKHIDLSKLSLNDSVRIQITDAVAISIVAKPKS